MDMSGSHRILAPRDAVYAALNDPVVLQASIPGCESVTRVSDTELTAKVTAKVGPVKAKFAGDVTLSDLNPPESYTITGEGKGGPAGFAKGGAKVRLEQDGDETVLTYEVHANVGGKLAQLGARLIDSTAKKMADEFFTNFAARAAAYGAEAPSAETSRPPTAEPVSGPPTDPDGEQASLEPASPAPVSTAPDPQPADTNDIAPANPVEEPPASQPSAAAPQPSGAVDDTPEPEAADAPATPDSGGSRLTIPMLGWIAGVIALVVALALLFS